MASTGLIRIVFGQKICLNRWIGFFSKMDTWITRCIKTLCFLQGQHFASNMSHRRHRGEWNFCHFDHCEIFMHTLNAFQHCFRLTYVLCRTINGGRRAEVDNCPARGKMHFNTYFNYLYLSNRPKQWKVYFVPDTPITFDQASHFFKCE